MHDAVLMLLRFNGYSGDAQNVHDILVAVQAGSRVGDAPNRHSAFLGANEGVGDIRLGEIIYGEINIAVRSVYETDDLAIGISCLSGISGSSVVTPLGEHFVMPAA